MQTKTPNSFPSGIIDIFKIYKVFDLNIVQVKKQGEISSEMDSILHKKVVKVTGNLSASNFIEIPNAMYGQKSLNLSGKYYYIFFKSFEDKKFIIELLFHVNNSVNLRFNFKYPLSEIKLNKTNVWSIDVPLKTESDWSLLRFDPLIFMETNYPKETSSIGLTSYENISLRSMTFYSTCVIRGVYVSNFLYDKRNLPKEMTYKSSDTHNPYSNLNIIDMTNNKITNDEEIDYQEKKEEKPKIDLLDNFESKMNEIEKKSKKIRDENSKKGKGDKPKTTEKLIKDDTIQDKRSILSDYDLKEHSNEILNRKMDSINREVLDKREIIKNIFKKTDEKKIQLLPDPILNLKYILGFTGKICNVVRFSRDEKKNIYFPSGNIMINFDNNNLKQKFFFGHSKAITHFIFSLDGQILFTAQEGKNAMIRIWKSEHSRCIKILTTPYDRINSMSISRDGKLLTTIGREGQTKELLLIWDISSIEETKISIRQYSHFNINVIKFSPYDQGLLLSCGKENIKFWRIKNDHLGGKAVVLNQYARNTNFLCLDFDNPFLGDNAVGKAYVGSSTGCVFQISCTTQELEKIFQLHDTSILSISVNDAFCVTGSLDGFLRVWPIDFQEFIIEAKHDSGICAIDIAYDGLDVVCGSLSGSIGILNIQSKLYKTVLRSPPGKISHLSIHPSFKYVFTIEDDKAIRIWDIDEKSEAFHYISAKDAPLSIDAPITNVFACGFASGILKVFDIDNTSILYECKAFNLPIKKLKFTVDSGYLIAMNSQGHLSIHDVKNGYIQVKVVKIDRPAQNVDLSMNSEGDYFATIGPESNCALVWNTASLGMKNRIPISNSFVSKVCLINKTILVVILENCNILIYSLANFEGTLIKEFANVHIEKVNDFLTTSNYKFLISGGEEGMIKIWDFKMIYKNYTSLQQFIGHSSGIKSIACIEQKSIIITVSENDGIFFWNFLGDLTFCDSEIMKEIEKFGEKNNGSKQKKNELKPNTMKPVSHLEKSYKIENNDSVEKRLNLKKERKELEKQILKMLPINVDQEQSEFLEKSKKVKNENEFLSELQQKLLFSPIYLPPKIERFTIPKISKDKMNKKYVLGYNSNSMNNLIFNKENNWFAFSVNNKVIIEFLSSENREQRILEEHQDEISCMVLSPDKRTLCSGSGVANKEENAIICVWDTTNFNLKRKLNFHYKGIQVLKFSFDGKYLVSIGNKEEKSLCIWNFSNYTVIDSKSLKFAVIDLVVERLQDKFFYFISISFEVLSFWRMDSSLKLEGFHIRFEDLNSEKEQNEVFTCVELTPYFDKVKTSFVLIGTNSGAILIVDKEKKNLLKKVFLFKSPILKIFFNEERMVLTGESPVILSWIIPYKKISSEYVFDFLEKEKPTISFLDNDIRSASFTTSGNEGLIGTTNHNLVYLNINESANLPILKAHSNCQINSFDIDINDKYLYSSGDDGTIRTWLLDSLDNESQLLYIDETCNNAQFNISDNVLIANFNHSFLRFFMMMGKNTKTLGKVHIPDHEINCFGFIFNNQGLLVSTLQDKLFVFDIQNWDSLSILFTEIETDLFPKDQFLKSIDTKNIDNTQTLVTSSFSDGSIATFLVSKENGKVNFNVIDKYNMFEYHISKSDDVQISELYKSLTRIRTNYISESKFSKKFEDLSFGIHESLQFLYIRNFKSNEVIRRIPLNYFPSSLTLTEDEKYISIGTKEGLILFVTRNENSINSGFNLDIFQGHFDSVTSIKFNRKSNQLISSSWSEIIVWDIL